MAVDFTETQLAHDTPAAPGFVFTPDEEDEAGDVAAVAAQPDVASLALAVALNALFLLDVVLWGLTSAWWVLPLLNAPALLSFALAWSQR
jgi:hypothetical protein